MESAPGKKKGKRYPVQWAAAVVALVLVLSFFMTAPGAAAVEAVAEIVADVFEILFPPRDSVVNVEGETEVVHQEAGGQEAETEADGSVAVPGFAIYYDTESYTMSEENGITYIRFAMDSDLPPCEMEIVHIPGELPDDAAEQARIEMSAAWETVTEIRDVEGKDGAAFYFAAGNSWDCACGNVYFLSDGVGGCFRITARYFVEATEGHGSRFAQMVQTFTLIGNET